MRMLLKLLLFLITTTAFANDCADVDFNKFNNEYYIVINDSIKCDFVLSSDKKILEIESMKKLEIKSRNGNSIILNQSESNQGNNQSITTENLIITIE